MADLAAPRVRLLRFEPFELDVRAGELRKHGIRIKLREQPVQILLMLLEHPGDVVLREEIRLRLWPNNTIVEFDHSINAAIKKLRDALGESADEPRYVETVARRGYRFLGEVEKIGEPQPEQQPAVHSVAASNNGLTGQVISHYRIIEKLGAGGMGVVYRAKDLKLGRQVALKFLPSPAGELPQSTLQRFEREALAASTLNHPHICTIHGFENLGGQPAIIMELMEGETLAERLSKGPLQRTQALRLAIEIASALVEAHRKGIVHRDLKPTNIMLTKTGAKVLDFGLAKVGTHLAPVDESATIEGTILGTLHYMSPEQARGKEADVRSDIFSFGLVLYEMITGKRALEGANPASIIAAILEREAPALEPEGLNRLVRACLAKDPSDRFQTARDLQRAIEWSVSGDAETSLLEGAPKPGSALRQWLAWSVAAALGLGLSSVAFLHFREKTPAPNVLPELALSIVAPSGRHLSAVGGLNVDRISPDGSTVLYRATDARSHIRRLSSLLDQLMPPLDSYGDPFWAPDSKSIAVPTVSGLMKVRVPNGAPELVTAPIPERGGSWGDKGIILFASSGDGRLHSVPAAGGKAFPIEVPGLKEGRYYNPEFLPGGDDFLFVFSPSDSAGAKIFIATMRDGKVVDPRLLFSNDTAAAFTSAGGGRILFVRNDNLYAQKIDLKARQIIGDPELVQERVASDQKTRNAYFSVSSSGTVVWRSGTAVTSQVMIFDRKGNRKGAAGASVPADDIRLSPDEAHVLVTSEAGSWVMESDGPGRTSLDSATPNLWLPGGSGVMGVKGAEIYQRSVSGSHELRSLARPPTLGDSLSLYGISGDGRRILYGDGTALLSFSLDGERRSEQVVEQQVDNAEMSPDGAWAVYNPRTEFGIYVQPLMSLGLRRQIANRGGFAVWRKDGKEIMYIDRDQDQNRVWSVRVDGVGTQLRFAPPETLFSLPRPLGMLSGSRPLAVSRDGSRIYFLQSTEEPDSGVIHVRTGAIR